LPSVAKCCQLLRTVAQSCAVLGKPAQLREILRSAATPLVRVVRVVRSELRRRASWSRTSELETRRHRSAKTHRSYRSYRTHRSYRTYRSYRSYRSYRTHREANGDSGILDRLKHSAKRSCPVKNADTEPAGSAICLRNESVNVNLTRHSGSQDRGLAATQGQNRGQRRRSQGDGAEQSKASTSVTPTICKQGVIKRYRQLECMFAD
jgi:hypothetical protein